MTEKRGLQPDNIHHVGEAITFSGYVDDFAHRSSPQAGQTRFPMFHVKHPCEKRKAENGPNNIHPQTEHD